MKGFLRLLVCALLVNAVVGDREAQTSKAQSSKAKAQDDAQAAQEAATKAASAATTQAANYEAAKQTVAQKQADAAAASADASAAGNGKDSAELKKAANDAEQALKAAEQAEEQAKKASETANAAAKNSADEAAAADEANKQAIVAFDDFMAALKAADAHQQGASEDANEANAKAQESLQALLDAEVDALAQKIAADEANHQAQGQVRSGLHVHHEQTSFTCGHQDEHADHLPEFDFGVVARGESATKVFTLAGSEIDFTGMVGLPYDARPIYFGAASIDTENDIPEHSHRRRLANFAIKGCVNPLPSRQSGNWTLKLDGFYGSTEGRRDGSAWPWKGFDPNDAEWAAARSVNGINLNNNPLVAPEAYYKGYGNGGLPTTRARCCATAFTLGNRDYVAQCDTSSCVNNFGMKNRNCFNYGSKEFPLYVNDYRPSQLERARNKIVHGNRDYNGVNAYPAGSAICPYDKRDKPVCDVRYYKEINGVNCRDRDEGVHCLGKVRCQTTGISFHGNLAHNAHSDGLPTGSLTPGYEIYEGGTRRTHNCPNSMWEEGADCFYDGVSENWKVCGTGGEDDPPTVNNYVFNVTCAPALHDFGMEYRMDIVSKFGGNTLDFGDQFPICTMSVKCTVDCTTTPTRVYDCRSEVYVDHLPDNKKTVTFCTQCGLDEPRCAQPKHHGTLCGPWLYTGPIASGTKLESKEKVEITIGSPFPNTSDNYEVTFLREDFDGEYLSVKWIGGVRPYGPAAATESEGTCIKRLFKFCPKQCGCAGTSSTSPQLGL